MAISSWSRGAPSSSTVNFIAVAVVVVETITIFRRRPDSPYQWR